MAYLFLTITVVFNLYYQLSIITIISLCIKTLSGELIHLSAFSTIFTKGSNFCDFLFAFLDNRKGSTLKGKNLLLEEQILSIKSCPFIRRQKQNKVVSPESVPNLP